MEANQLLGFLKFFHNPEYMELMLDGVIHCQTPEAYRLASQEGRGDLNESCSMSWRRVRGDPDIELHINGRTVPLEDLNAVTVHGERGDSWLTCWLALRLPAEQEDLDELKRDLARMKVEFGSHYVFLPAFHAVSYLNRLKESADKPMWAAEVSYEEHHVRWSARCKSAAYSYQREYRVGFGECDVHDTEPYVFSCPGGFRDLMYADKELQLVNEDTGKVLLDVGSL